VEEKILFPVAGLDVPHTNESGSYLQPLLLGRATPRQAGQAGTATGSDHSHEQQTTTTGWTQ